MRPRGKLAALLASAALLLGAAPAQAKQLDARDEPTVKGPFTEDKHCQPKAEPADSVGDVVGVGRVCLRFYHLDPEAETDPVRDYGILWLQSSVDSREGWCSVKVTTKVRLPDAVEQHAHAPQAITGSKRRAVTVELTALAQEQAIETATVEQSFQFYPRSFEPDLMGEKSTFRLEWKGHTPRPLGFAGAVEVSWDSATGPPADIPFDLAYRFEEGC